MVQKGPFEIDTVVELSQLDSAGIPTGNTIQTKVNDNKGHFNFEIPDDWNIGESNFIKIMAEGFYFNEITGKKTDKKSLISSISNDPNLSSVNLISHWSAKRTDALLQQGKTLEDALHQSKKELSDIFGIENSHQLDLTQNKNFKEDNALLLLLSGSLMEVAKQHASNPQQIIDEIATDFADDGKLSELGDDWFIRMQAKIRDNPSAHIDSYAKALKTKRGIEATTRDDLPAVIKQVRRPSAIIPEEMTVEPGETIILDGRESHGNPIEDAGSLINYTWFRVDQQAYDIPFSDRFIPNPSITVPNEETELLFAIVVTNEQKDTDTAVIKVIVKKPPTTNNPPVADSQISVEGVFTNEDTPIAITLTGSDIDNDPLTFVMATTPLSLAYGVIEGTAPNLIYYPSSNFFGNESFTFKVNDGFEDSTTAIVEITVASINDAPTAEDKTYSIITGGSIPETKVTLEGNDPDGDNNKLVFEIVTLPSSGSLVLTGTDLGIDIGVILDKNFDYIPSSQSSPQSDSFTYRVKDEGGLFSSVKKVDLVSGIVNDPPVARGRVDKGAIASKPVTEQFPVVLIGSDSTDDSLITSYVWTQVDIGSNDPTVSLSPISSDPSNMAFNAPIPNSANASQGNPLILTFRLTVTDDGTPALNDSTTETDPDPLKDDVLVYINSRPIADAGSDRTVTQGDNVTLIGSGSSDLEGPINTYSWTQRTGSPVTVAPNTSTPSLASFVAPSVSGSDIELIFDLVVTDGNGIPSVADSVTITVTAQCVTAKPVAIVGVDRHVAERTVTGASTVVTLNGSGFADGACNSENGVYGNGYIWTQVGSASDPQVTFTYDNPYSLNRPKFSAPSVATITVLTFQLIVNDDVSSSPESDPVTMTVTIHPDATTLPANLPPTGTDYAVEVLGNGNGLNVRLIANDPDGDDVALNYTIITQPTKGTLNTGNLSYGSVNYQPVYPVATTDSFVFKVIDQDGKESTPITVTINRIVEPLGNQTPTAKSGIVTIIPLIYDNRRIEVLLEKDYITNPDVDDYIKIIGTAKNLTGGLTIDLGYSSTDGNLLRVRNTSWSTSAKVDYEYYVIDKYGRKSSTETITIEFVNSQPTANSQAVATILDINNETYGAIIFPIELSGSDLDANPGLKYEIVTPPDPSKQVTINLDENTGKLKFGSPLVNTPNPFTFTFRVIDKEGLASDSAVVTVEGYIYGP